MNENGGHVRRARSQRARASAVKTRARREGPRARHQAARAHAARNASARGAVVEPMISTQWFVQDEADSPSRRSRRCATDAPRSSPKSGRRRTTTSSTNIQDWCISRQLWWGHQIPAWHCAERPRHGRAREPDGVPTCRSAELEQDEDVLDTWFSSGLWPFATLGWPDDDARARQVLSRERSRDRLRHPLLLGRPHDDDGPPLHEGGAVPARALARHGRRRERRQDEQGEGQRHRPARSHPRRDVRRGGEEDAARRARAKRRSPSSRRLPVGGADGRRASRRSAPTRCASRWRRYSPQAKRIALAPKRIEGYRHFCNKIWNATRFALPYLEQHPGRRPGDTPRAPRWRCATAGSCRASRRRSSGRPRPRRLSPRRRVERRSTASSGTSSATGTSRSPSRFFRPRSRARHAEAAATSRCTCSRRRCARSIRSCPFSPRSSGSGYRAPHRAPRRSRLAPFPDRQPTAAATRSPIAR